MIGMSWLRYFIEKQLLFPITQVPWFLGLLQANIQSKDTHIF
jgi:hypothetical protein